MRAALAAVLLATACCAGPGAVSGPTTNKGTPMTVPTTVREANDAMALATDFLATLSLAAADYRVFEVRNVLSGEGASPTRWRIGFKRRALVPEKPDQFIGKGGEVYVEVDTATRQAQASRGGS